MTQVLQRCPNYVSLVDCMGTYLHNNANEAIFMIVTIIEDY
jgi:hypothetical protein